MKREYEYTFENMKRELCETPVLSSPRRLYILDADASVVAISGILHQEQESNRRTVLSPIAYGSKVLSETEMNLVEPKEEMFALVRGEVPHKFGEHSF